MNLIDDKRILRGTPTDRAVARGALTDPTGLAAFEKFARDRLGVAPRP